MSEVYHQGVFFWRLEGRNPLLAFSSFWGQLHSLALIHPQSTPLQSLSSNVLLILPTPFYKDCYDNFGSIQTTHLKILSLINSINFPLPCMVKFWGVGCGCLWGSLFCLTQWVVSVSDLLTCIFFFHSSSRFVQAQISRVNSMVSQYF